MIKVIAFDIDGVIYDSSNIIEFAYIDAIKLFIKENHSLSLVSPKKEEILKHVGKTYKEIVSVLFPNLPHHYQMTLRKHLLAILDDFIRQKKGILLPDVEKTLAALFHRGYKLTTASNGSGIYCNAILETYAIKHLFDKTEYVDFDIFFDKADLLAFYLQHYSILPDQLVMVGDRIMDFEAAEKNSVYFIGIEGHGHNKELQNAPYVIHNIEELTSIIPDM